jgi:hypothetical protein
VKFGTQIISKLTRVSEVLFVYTYRVFTKEVNTFRNTYFAVTLRKYKDVGIDLV